MKSPLSPWISNPEARGRLGWTVLRVSLALLIAAHGWARLIEGGVPPFGQFLEDQGFPMGIAWAAAVTGLEIIG
jgi:putative oxidoreductase